MEGPQTSIFVVVKHGPSVLYGPTLLRVPNGWGCAQIFAHLMAVKVPQKQPQDRIEGLELIRVSLHNNEAMARATGGKEGKGMDMDGSEHHTPVVELGTLVPFKPFGVIFHTGRDAPPPSPSETTLHVTATLMANTNRTDWLPGLKPGTSTLRPAKDLAFNHAVRVFLAHGIGFQRDSTPGQAAVKALQDLAYYMDPVLRTIARRYSTYAAGEELEAIEWAAMNGEDEIARDLFDMRHCNPGSQRGEQHVAFFNLAVGIAEQELKPQVAANRRGGEVTHQGVDMSLSALYRRIKARFEEQQSAGEIDKGQGVPSYLWYLYHFLPRYPRRKGASQYRGVIKIVTKIISRSHRPDHPLECTSCGKPRVVYIKSNNRELTKDDAAHLIARAAEDNTYYCG